MEFLAANPDNQNNYFQGGRAILCPWSNEIVFEKPIYIRPGFYENSNRFRQRHEDIAGNILHKSNDLSSVYQKLKPLFEARFNKNPEDPRAQQMFLCMCGCDLIEMVDTEGTDQQKCVILYCSKAEGNSLHSIYQNSNDERFNIEDILDGLLPDDEVWDLINRVLLEIGKGKEQSTEDDYPDK